MEGIQGSPEDRERLDALMDKRRRSFRIRWSEVARRAGMTPQNLLRIRKGQISISWEAADGIEHALLWERGSVEAAVVHGREPRERTPADTPATAMPRIEELPAGEQQRYLMARDFMRTQGRELTVPLWRAMRDEYLRLEEAERAPEPDHSQ